MTSAPRSIRGKGMDRTKDAIFCAQQRGASTAVRNRVTDVVKARPSSGSELAREQHQLQHLPP
jgi:hypothetical protein